MASGQEKIVLIDDASDAKVEYNHNCGSRVRKFPINSVFVFNLAPNQDLKNRSSIEKDCFEEKHTRSPSRPEVPRC